MLYKNIQKTSTRFEPVKDCCESVSFVSTNSFRSGEWLKAHVMIVMFAYQRLPTPSPQKDYVREANLKLRLKA